MLTTTLNKIRDKSPCSSGWNTLLKSLGKTQADDEPVSLKYILKSNNIEDAVWCLSTFEYKEYCLFLADVAESVLSIFEKKYPDDKRPRKAIEGIRLFKSGNITIEDLKVLQLKASAAYDDAYDDDAAYAYAASSAASSAAASAAYASASAAAYASAYAYAYASRKNKWNEIEQLFIKHFC